MKLTERLKDASLEEIKEVLMEQEREITELRKQVQPQPVSLSDSSGLLDLREVFTTLDHLVRYGMIHTIKNVTYPSGSHQHFLNKAMEICDLLREQI